MTAHVADLVLARAWLRVSQDELARGRYEQATTALDRTLAHAVHVAARSDIAALAEGYAVALVHSPEPIAEAMLRCHRVSTVLAEQVGSVPSAMAATMAVLLAAQGRGEAARAVLGEHAGRVRPGACAVAAAAVEACGDRWDAAEAILQTARTVRRRRLTCAPAVTHALARVLLAQERVTEADDLLRGSGRHDHEGPAVLADLSGMAARVLAIRGQRACARLLAESAVAIAEATDSVVSQGLALTDRAQVLHLLGERDGSRASALEGRRRFLDKGHLVGARHASSVSAAVA